MIIFEMFSILFYYYFINHKYFPIIQTYTHVATSTNAQQTDGLIINWSERNACASATKWSLNQALFWAERNAFVSGQNGHYTRDYFCQAQLLSEFSYLIRLAVVDPQIRCGRSHLQEYQKAKFGQFHIGKLKMEDDPTFLCKWKSTSILF